jgi:hypothetical protein
MKRRLTAVVTAAALMLAAFTAVSQEAENGRTKDVKLFMRAKLVHSQKVLEGLTLENFDAVTKHAQQMALMSNDASWNVIQSEEYYERSADFRRSLVELKQAAEKKNIDGAALAYMSVTMKCIECHRYLRQVQHVESSAR